MADLDAALRQRAQEIAKEQDYVARQAQSSNAAKLGAEAARFENLLNNPEVAWFIATHMQPVVDAENADALNVQRTASERNDSAQRHDVAKALTGLLEKLTEDAKELARQAFENLPKNS